MNNHITSLSEKISPILVEYGFVKRKRDWLKYQSPLAGLVEIQIGETGERFCINLGVIFEILPDTPKEVLHYSTATAEICKRLTSSGKGDQWWSLTLKSNEETQILELIKQEVPLFFLPYFQKPSVLETLTLSDISEPNWPENILIGSNRVRASMLLALMAEKRGEIELALKFSEYGLTICDRAVGPKSCFKNIIKRNKNIGLQRDGGA